MKTRCEEYFQVLGERFGMDFWPGEDGSCLMSVDERLGVMLRGNEDARRMELSAVVADELPEGVAYSDMQDIMSLSLGPLFDAPGIGREPESGAIVLYALFPFDTTTPADFAEAIAAFIDRANGLVRRFAAIGRDAIL